MATMSVYSEKKYKLLLQTQESVLIHLSGEKVEKSVSQNIFKTNGRNVQHMIKVVELFRNHKKLGFRPCHGLYTCIKS